jgi:site-specific DNA recombinase
MDRIIKRVDFPKIMQPQFLKVCAYTRVSSGKDAMLHSLSAQVSYYSNLINNHPGWIYCGVYADEALTGTKENRDGFQQHADRLPCNGENRYGHYKEHFALWRRNTVTLVGNRPRAEKGLGVDVYFEEQNIHTLSADGELMLTILASYAQEESRSVSENQKWRVKRNFEAGIPWNGRMLGYRMQDGKYYIIPEEAELVRRIYREFLDGMGRNRIAAKLNDEGIQPTRYGEEWHPQTIAKILRNYAYTGNLLLQRFYCESYITKKTVPNNGQKTMYHAERTHEAIIPLEEWKAVQTEIERRAEQHKSKPPAQPSFFYTGRIQCAKCGKNFRRKTTAARVVWICATLNTKGKKHCASKQIPEATLDELVRQVTDDPFSVKKIIADDGNTLHFHFSDGSVVTRTWTDRSRAESWTPEMKEKARQQSLARRRQKS